MKNGTMVACTVLLLCLARRSPAEAGVIDIPNGNLLAGSWGPSSGQSYGQIFTVPAGDSVLVDYSFSVNILNARFLFVSQVYAWDGAGIAGPALFNSPALFSPLPLDTFTTVVFSPSVVVTSGRQYIALVTNEPRGVGLGGSPDSGGGMFLNQNDPYVGGQFAFTSGDPEIGPWSLTLSNADAVFHATFVPEPATLVLLGYGVAGLASVAVWRRRRRK